MEFYDVIFKDLMVLNAKVMGVSNPAAISQNIQTQPSVPDPGRVAQSLLAGRMSWEEFAGFQKAYLEIGLPCVLLLSKQNYILVSPVALANIANLVGISSQLAGLDFVRIVVATGHMDLNKFTRDPLDPEFFNSYKNSRGDTKTNIAMIVKQFMKEPSVVYLSAISKLLQANSLSVNWTTIHPEASVEDIVELLFTSSTVTSDEDIVIHQLQKLYDAGGMTQVFSEVCKVLSCIPSSVYLESGAASSFVQTWRSLNATRPEVNIKTVRAKNSEGANTFISQQVVDSVIA